MMRKTLLLLSVLLLFGCTKIDKKELDYQKYVKTIIKEESKFVNKTSTGYKYYLPRGVYVKNENNNNSILSCDNINLYFFVDIISYYYKKNINKNEYSKYDYYKKIDDKGYLAIDENNGNYLVVLFYNYSVIEFNTTKDNIPKLLTTSSIILNSVEFNDNIIEKELKKNNDNSGESIYEINELKKNNSKFSQYLNSYEEEKRDENKLPD